MPYCRRSSRRTTRARGQFFRPADVAELQKPRVQLVPGAQGGDHGDARLPGGDDQVQLAAHQVDAVCQIVPFRRRGKKLRPGVRGIPGRYREEATLRADLLQACGHHLRLGPPHGGGGGAELAVAVALRDRVLVHQGQRAHPCAGQGLGAPASHAPQAEHGHMALPEPGHGLRPQKHLCAQKPLRQSQAPLSHALPLARRQGGAQIPYPVAALTWRSACRSRWWPHSPPKSPRPRLRNRRSAGCRPPGRPGRALPSSQSR